MSVLHNNNTALTPEKLCNEFKVMFEESGYTKVTLDIVKEPFRESLEDYNVVYSLRFLPPALEMTQLEIWITDKGFMGVGIETWPRVLKRFDKTVDSVRFAVGHEPLELPKDAMLALIKLVSSGKISIKKSGLSLFNLFSFKGYVLISDFNSLKATGYYYLDFLSPCEELPFDDRFLRFKPWE